MAPTRLLVVDTVEWPEIATAVRQGPWTAEPGRPDRLRRTFVDTFDGRVLGRGQVLEVEERRREPVGLTLIDRTTGRSIARVELPPAAGSPAAAPRFAWDLPAGRLADELVPVLGMRALLPFASVSTRRQTVGIRDREAKLVARVVLDDNVLVWADGVGRRQPLGRTLEIVALRGYERETAKLTLALDDALTLAPATDDLLATVVARVGRPPGAVTSKFRVKLAPDLRSVDAAVAILDRLLVTIEANRQGTLDQLDTEFLHDLRVAVRRTRSGLKAFPGIFRPSALARFVPGFRWVQQATGAARDLDVQLLEFDEELRRLPPDVAETLQPLQLLLEAKHRAAHRATDRALRSVRFLRLLERWQGFLEAPPPGPDADRPIVDVASERIWRAYRRVVKPGRAITAASPADDLHDLRKRGKELRYLLEFFAPLHPKTEVGRLVTELKALQDNLGAFQDDQVQAAGLRSYAEELLELTSTSETLVALGQLVAHHEDTSKAARAEFAGRFAAFDDLENRERFAALVRPEGADGA
ncbi:MAG: CHAD domain-containing protein [Acidimicrobiales bacterium]